MTIQTVPLRDISTFVRGVSFNKSQEESKVHDANIPLLRSGNIQNHLDITRDLIFLPKSVVSSEQLLRKGDIVICLSSGSPQVVGKTAVFRGEGLCSVGAFCGIVRPIASVDADYLSFWFRSPSFINWRDGQARGASIQNLRFSELAKLEITLPNTTEQRRIAACLKSQLAAVEEARQAVAAQKIEIEALKAALYREAFADITPIGVPPVFPSAPSRWHWTKLTDVARLESGHTPSRFRSDWWVGNVSWISLTEIRALDGCWVAETQMKTNEAGIANSAARILPRGTVCFSRTASVGFVAIMGKPMTTSQDFANWVCGDELDPEFLMHALIRSRSELRSMATGATHKTIYMPALKTFHVCVPVKREQKKIVKHLEQKLEAVNQLRFSTKASLKDIERLPSRLLAQAFGEA